MKHRLLALAAVSAALVLTGCGNSEPSTPTAEPTVDYTVAPIFPNLENSEEPDEQVEPTTEPAPQPTKTAPPRTGPAEVVTNFLAAVTATRLAKACDMVTDEWVEQIRFEKSIRQGTGCKDTLTAYVQRDGVPTEWATAQPQRVGGAGKRVIVTAAPSLRWILTKNDGAWHLDSTPRGSWTKEQRPKKERDKPKRDPKPNNGEKPKPPVANDPKPSPPDPTPVNIDQQGPGRWVPNWCSMTTTMSKATAIEFMGEATSTFGSESSQPQLRWTDGRLKFTAFLKGNRIWQLQADYASATRAEKARLTCDAVRR